ncbi:MAG: MurR/RpiR family transcriptional regulator, partial [Deltaproteobacteria bacterium]
MPPKTKRQPQGEGTSTPQSRRAQTADGGDIISRIQRALPDIRPAEKRVAQLILADASFAVHASSAELARQAGVSEPTVTRFSRAVGCAGLRELKVMLAQSLVVGRIYIEPPPHEGSDLARPAMWRSVFTEKQVQRADIDRAAEAIAACGKLVAFGVGGGSSMAVAEVEHRFFRLGKAVTHSSDPHLMRMIAATFSAGDVVIALSTTGKAQDVIEAATIAK